MNTLSKSTNDSVSDSASDEKITRSNAEQNPPNVEKKVRLETEDYSEDDSEVHLSRQVSPEGLFSRGPALTLTRSMASESAVGALGVIERLDGADAALDPYPPPDGGLLAWLQVLAAWLALFNSWGYVNSWGVFQDYFAQNLDGTSASTIGWIGSVQAFISQGLALVVGRLVDMGYQRPILIAGCFLTTFGVMMLSLATEFYQIFLAQGVCVPLGSCCCFISTVTLVAQYFSTKRATAIGLATTGSSIGGIVFPIMARRLIVSVGYAWAMRSIGFVMLGTLTVPLLVSKVRIPPRVTGPLIDWPSFKDLNFMLTALGFLLGAGSLFSYIFYVNSYATATNVSPSVAPYMVAILNAASTVGRILPNLVADRVGVFNVLIPCLSVCAILMACWIRIDNTAGEVILAALFGGFSGTYLSLTAPTFASLTPELNKMGSRTGLGLSLASFGFLLSGPATGALIKGDNYLHAKIFGFVLCMATIVCFVIARFMICGELRHKV